MPATPMPNATVGAIARKVFLKNEPSVPWANVQALLQIMQTGSLNMGRKSNIEQMTSSTNTVGTAERWKFPVDMTPLSNGGSYDRGGSFTFANEDTLAFGEALPAFYQQPVSVPISDIDVHAQASANENGVAYLVSKLRNAKIRLGQIIAGDITAVAPGANDIDSLLTIIDSTGSANGLSQGTYANWASTETDLAGARLTLRTLARQIRDIRRQNMAKIDLVVCGSAVHQFLVDEAEAQNLPMYDIVEVFGRNAETSEPNLFLETSHDVIKVNGAPVIIDESLDTNSASTVLGISLQDLCLHSPNKANFVVEGWEKVNLSAGADAQRAQIKWDGFFACFNRATHFKFTDARTA